VRVGSCLLVVAALLASTGAQAASSVPAFDHVIVIVFENKEATSVLGNASAPTFNAYARRFVSMTRYYGVAHPSLPNYLALVSGSTQGIRTDCTGCVVSAPSLPDTLAAAGRTWKAYAEGLPRAGYLGATSGRYAKRHNPFAYFRSVVTRPARRARIVPFAEFARDLRAQALPDYAFVIPDLCHDMHDCPVAVGDAWLRRFAPPLLRLEHTGVFVLFDEGRSNLNGGGHVAGLVLGTAVRPATRFTAVTNHYGVLRAIEMAWGLPLLARSAQAGPILDIWR
jgi:phosphatidylinositol-3-phosphatase